MKKQSDLSRLMGYAGNYRYFTYASWVLSAVSALVALIPFLYIWMILRDVLAVAPDYAQAVNIPHYGWMAVLFAVLSTVASADCIYVVQDGRITETGTKDELCAQNGLFARMWQDYQASVQWKVAKEG